MKNQSALGQHKYKILAAVFILPFLALSGLFGSRAIIAQSENPTQSNGVLASTGSGFTYQGQLNDGGIPANGSYTFQFALYDSATVGLQIGSTQTKAITVNEGIFTTVLNEGNEFGATAFTGEARYLEIRVSDNGGTTYTTLTPRQSLTAAPYAQSLRPGAIINGTVNNGAILNLSNNGTNAVGLSVTSATANGIQVVSADVGLAVASANNGVYVVNATTHGLIVGSAANGVYVLSASTDGVHVESATNGVRIQNATQKGVLIATAEEDGVYVANAGNPINSVSSSQNNGFEIAGAQGNGLFVGYASAGMRVNSANDGVLVDSASSNGVRVVSSDFDGVSVYSAGNDGLYVGAAADDGIQATGTNWAGNFIGDITVTGACTGCKLAVFGVNTGDSPLQPGDIVTLQGTRAGNNIGQPMLMEVGQTSQVGAAVVGVVAGRGELAQVGRVDDGSPAEQLVPRDGVAQVGDYVHIIIFGPAQVKASTVGGTIQMGERLAVDNSGAARTLQVRTLDGMNITESAPTIGVALQGIDESVDGLIWVLVNPQ